MEKATLVLVEGEISSNNRWDAMEICTMGWRQERIYTFFFLLYAGEERLYSQLTEGVHTVSNNVQNHAGTEEMSSIFQCMLIFSD